MPCNFISIKWVLKTYKKSLLSPLPLKVEATPLAIGLGGPFSSALLLLPRVGDPWGLSPVAWDSEKPVCNLKVSSQNGLLFPGVWKACIAIFQKQFPWIARMAFCSNTCPVCPSPALPGTPDSNCPLPGTKVLTHSGAKFLYRPRAPWKASHADFGKAACSARKITFQPWIPSGERHVNMHISYAYVRDTVWKAGTAVVRSVR